MIYPTLSTQISWELGIESIRQMLSPNVDVVEAEIVWVGSGERFDLEIFANEPVIWLEVANGVDKSNGSGYPLPSSILSVDGDLIYGRDQVEGWAAARLMTLLTGTDLQVLDDPGFWRFLSLRFFWSFIAWRESGAFSSFRTSNDMPIQRLTRYFDAQNPTEDVLSRMFLRANSIRSGSNDYSLCWALKDSADFWRSHVIRVRTGESPNLTKAFATLQLERRIDTDQLRVVAKQINRLWTNLDLNLYTEQECHMLLSELWPLREST